MPIKIEFKDVESWFIFDYSILLAAKISCQSKKKKKKK